jgi:hypothetical protein
MRFKNISEQDLSVPNVGIIKAGESAEMPEGFHNANFEPVKVKKEDK